MAKKKQEPRYGRWRKTYHADGTVSEWEEVKQRTLHNEINSEPVICKAGGETIDFGVGDVVEVSDSFEKARELRKRGMGPAPGRGSMGSPRSPKKLEDFKDYWQRTMGRPYEEVTQHMREVPRR